MKLNTTVKWLIVIAILANCVGMFFPSLSSTFTPYYGSIAKNVVLSHNWLDLTQLGHDWLDKPHFPFWMTAVSFSLFGINSFAYILPGFLFNLLGIFYTYKLAKFWYNGEVGLVAALFTASALHLMLSSIDVRAEAYLIGEIMPACYYLLRYDQKSKLKYMLLAAVFTALALMTKGIFILVTIISGIACLWIYRGQWRNFISFKWIVALGLSLVFIAPEIIALYAQFDLHPEKIVFGQSHVSGIRWFFWDSQFGRFFNTGPIVSTNPPPFHYLFFVHTFLWAYLPWWPMFFLAIWKICRNFNQQRSQQAANVYLLASFFITFILFSATKFQVDHYTNIIFPFASIICAEWFMDIKNQDKTHFIMYIEVAIAALLLLLVCAVSHYALTGLSLYIVLAMAILGLVIFVVLRHSQWWFKTLVYPTIAIITVFVFAMLVNGISYAKYDAGYQIAKYLNQTEVAAPIVGYRVDLLSLDLHANSPYILLDDINTVKNQQHPFYIVTKLEDKQLIMQNLPNASLINTISGGSIETFLGNITNKEHLQQHLTKYVILEIN